MKKLFILSRDTRIIMALVALTAFSFALIGGRIVYTHWITFGFLLWNIVLAWIPFCIALGMKIYRDRLPGNVLILLGIIWLLFYPNAPYIITDFFTCTNVWACRCGSIWQ